MTKIIITLRPSKILAIVLLSLHLGAIFCLLFLSFPIWLTILLIILICYSLYISLQRHVFLKGTKIVIKLWNKENNLWRLSNNRNEILNAHLRNDSFISRYLIILNFKVAKKLFISPIILCNDSVDKETLRRLRVLLNMRNSYA